MINAARITDAVILASVMAKLLFAPHRSISQIKLFAIKNLCALWANVQAQYAWHTDWNHVNVFQSQKTLKLRLVNCVVSCRVKKAPARAHLNGTRNRTMFQICIRNQAHHVTITMGM